MRKTALFLTVVGVAACAELHWQKPEADAATLAADTAACRAQAQARIARSVGPEVPSSTDPRFGADAMQPSPADRRMRERQLADSCMRDKGYTLVPVGR